MLVRHGQSDWNLKNLFTGWRDVDLTDKGVAEAREAGRKLKAPGLTFDVAFTSALKRAQRTLDLMLAEMGQTGIPVFKDQALNERDYGDSSGLNKDDARKKWGEEQVHIWRRSYDIAPPGGETLKDTAGAHAALLRDRDPAARAARRTRAGGRARQLVARAGHGAGPAVAREISTEARHRRADDLPAGCRCDGGVETGFGGLAFLPSPRGATLFTLSFSLQIKKYWDEGKRERSTFLLSLRDPGFPAQHGALAGQAPVIAGEVAVLADDAVARHHEADGILADGGADCARGSGRSGRGGESE